MTDDTSRRTTEGTARRGGRAGRLARLARPVSPAIGRDGPEAPPAPAPACAPRDDAAPGSSKPKAGRMLIIACGALAREILAAVRLSGLDGIDVACLPAKLHNRPEKIPAAVRCRIRSARSRDGYDRVRVLYGDCGTGGALDRVLGEEGVERIAGDHCYAFYAGLDAFAAMHEAEPATFYLTDYLVRQFDPLVWRGLGLDRHPELFDIYFGRYKRLIYLGQFHERDLVEQARNIAVRLRFEFVYKEAGITSLRNFVTGDLA